MALDLIIVILLIASIYVSTLVGVILCCSLRQSRKVENRNSFGINDRSIVINIPITDEDTLSGNTFPLEPTRKSKKSKKERFPLSSLGSSRRRTKVVKPPTTRAKRDELLSKLARANNKGSFRVTKVIVPPDEGKKPKNLETDTETTSDLL